MTKKLAAVVIDAVVLLAGGIVGAPAPTGSSSDSTPGHTMEDGSDMPGMEMAP